MKNAAGFVMPALASAVMFVSSAGHSSASAGGFPAAAPQDRSAQPPGVVSYYVDRFEQACDPAQAAADDADGAGTCDAGDDAPAAAAHRPGRGESSRARCRAAAGGAGGCHLLLVYEP